ncbi:MAG: HIT domain-containing protein [archaeon]
MPDCIFCKILAGQIPAHMIYTNDSAASFLDISPAAEGHSLVVPKKHYETLSDIPSEEFKNLMSAVKKVANAVVASTASTGFNIIQANKPSAGQVVPHVHFHVVPRKDGDGLQMDFNRKSPTPEQLKSTAGRIRQAIQ